MKYRPRNSSIENSLNNYNQICISGNGKIAVKFLKVQVAVTADTDGYTLLLTLIMTLDSMKYYFYAK